MKTNLLLRKDNMFDHHNDQHAKENLSYQGRSATGQTDKDSASVSYKSIALLALIFISSICLLYLVYLSFPNLEE